MGTVRHARLRGQHLRVVPPGRIRLPRDAAAAGVPPDLQHADHRHRSLSARPRERRALRSGSFYFYHRLGFRPRDPGVIRVLAEEAREDRRRLALPLADPGAQAAGRRRGLPDAAGWAGRSREALARNGRLGARRPPGRARVRRRSEPGDARVDGAGRSNPRRHAARRVGRWRAALVRSDVARRRAHPGPRRLVPHRAARARRVMRAKGSGSEMGYARRLDAHARLRRSLEALSRTGRRP